ncbi:MAG: hypothetical protein AAF518_15300, partial [Spirochaetota bacterium]
MGNSQGLFLKKTGFFVWFKISKNTFFTEKQPVKIRSTDEIVSKIKLKRSLECLKPISKFHFAKKQKKVIFL